MEETHRSIFYKVNKPQTNLCCPQMCFFLIYCHFINFLTRNFSILTSYLKLFSLFTDLIFIHDCVKWLNSLYTNTKAIYSSTSVIRTLPPTGKAVPTWRHYKGSMGFPSQTQRCWRNGNVFRRRPRIETIARLAKWVTVGSHVRAHPACLKTGKRSLVQSEFWYIIV